MSLCSKSKCDIHSPLIPTAAPLRVTQVTVKTRRRLVPTASNGRAVCREFHAGPAARSARRSAEANIVPNDIAFGRDGCDGMIFGDICNVTCHLATTTPRNRGSGIGSVVPPFPPFSRRSSMDMAE